MTTPSKRKSVKAWAVIDIEKADLIAGMSSFGHPIEWVRPFDIFFHRKEAILRRSWIAYPKLYKVVPCTIVYSLPNAPRITKRKT